MQTDNGGTFFRCKWARLSNMKYQKRLRRTPHEDSYLRIFNRHSAPRSRRKRQWPEQLSLAAKKRLLATHPCGAPLQKGGDVKTQPRGRKEGDGGLLHLPSEGTPRAAGEPRRHAKTNGYPASQPISGSLVDSAEVQTSEGGLTLQDCWPSSKLTLQWLRLGGEKLDAFQAALRRRLSVPVKACHWPLPECTKCTAWPVFVRGALKFGIRPAAFQLAGSQHYEIVGQNDGAEAVREWNSPNGESTGGPYPEAACRCTYAKNCALVISEDPLLRPSLLVMSLGISEVHTVVMKESNWESAETFAKCFGCPESLKVFRSLEALEEEVFEHRIAQVLSCEKTPPHTCGGAAKCGCEQRGDAMTNSAEGLGVQHHCQEAYAGIAKLDGTAEVLQAHLHRYRIALIDDQYCGPIVSAFGLPGILQFVRTHTCPACCPVVPRRWQTLAAPASCPPLVPSSQYLKIVEGEKPYDPQQRRIAESGRTMSGASIRLEDVSLSSRFCVLESFELASLAGCSYKDPDGISACGLRTEDAGGNVRLGRDGVSTENYVDSCLSENEAPRAKCLRCARDRQLRWSKQRHIVMNGNVVCGVEVTGPCAGLIIRNHILVDEGISLFPSAPLMVFLPDEVHLSTRHVVMLEPVCDSAMASEHLRAVCTPPRPSKSTSVELQLTQPACASTMEACESSADGSPQAERHEDHKYLVPYTSAAATPVGNQLQKARPPIPPWRSLKAQQFSYCWQWTTVCDGIRQSEFGIQVTLRDLYQTAVQPGSVGVSLPTKSEAV